MEIIELQEIVHQNAVDKGFYNRELSNPHLITLILTEICEIVEADRKGLKANKNILNQPFDKKLFEENVKNTLEDEIADTIIRCLDMAGYRGYELKINSFIPKIHPNKPLTDYVYFLLTFIFAIDDYQRKLEILISNWLNYCSFKKIDIMRFIELKIQYNKLREYKNGKLY